MKHINSADQRLRVKEFVNNDAKATENRLRNETQEEGLIGEVRRAVESLPLLEREALILREYEGLQLNEIAAIVDADELTVADRLRTARKRLQASLAHYLPGNAG
jgi:DNA-directed RNA polymerase specialized sigma24 family protein